MSKSNVFDEDTDEFERPARYQSVVRVFAATQASDYDSPWQAESPSSSTGSGVIVGEGLILTGAHVVADATFLQVQRLDQPDKGVATVRSICHDADLALLQTEDTSFTDGIPPAQIGDLPRLSDEVCVVGFPIGGEEVSITEGIVSRIETQKYSHSQRRLLAVTVDAAINEGNSGGPVFLDDEVVGIAFQKLGDADNIGEMVPAPLLQSFLEQAPNHAEVRVPGLGISTQRLESALLRKHIKMPEGKSGILIAEVNFGASAFGVLKKGDAMLSIDGYNIANNGTVRFLDRHRTTFDVVLGLHREGDKIPVEVLRAGEVFEVEMELKELSVLVSDSAWDKKPTYLFFGGLAIQPLTRDYLSTWEEWWDKAPSELLTEYYGGSKTEERQEVVVLSRVFADPVTVGFESHSQEILTHAFGEKIRSLHWLTSRLDAAEGMIELKTSTGATLVFDAQEIRKRHGLIMERYRISRDRSDDLPARPW